jgi:protein SPT2
MVTGKPKSAYTMRDIDSDDDDMEADAFALETEERVRSGPILLIFHPLFFLKLQLTSMWSSSSRIALKEDMLALEDERRHEEEKRQRKKEKQRTLGWGH